MSDDDTTPNDFPNLKDIQSTKRTAHTPTEPIAVIGMGCRFPGGANSPEAFWELLQEERNVASIIPEDRWSLDDFYDPDPEAAGKCYTRVGHFLTDPKPSEFDPQFFRISPREAKVMDPQQRIILEVVWEALENASIAPTSLYGSDTGVFIGCYDDHHLTDYDLRSNREVEFYLATSIVQSITVGRISYFLNLHGPNFAINTACSSSLIALHQACRSLRERECSIALTGGVNIIVSPSFYLSLSKGRMLSPDGLCKSFDNTADGYGRGEGCGVIVLKRLEDALEDGDTILALIRGSATNHDGRTAGITAPNGTAQQKVIQTALKNSGISPKDVHYVEAHGTGTAVGDPIELSALAEIFKTRDKSNPLRIGSVKTNIGHLEAAAGIAGVIKTVLALKHEHLPKHLNVTELNKQIQWEKVPLQVLTQEESWSIGTTRRIAGVSSYGFGGSNAHVILEGAEFVNPKPIPSTLDRPRHILTLSAQNEQSLTELSQRYAVYMKSHPKDRLPDIAYTANTGRTHMRERLAITGESATDVAAALDSFANGEIPQEIIRLNLPSNTPTRLGFIFTGQGAQYPGMGQGLYEHLPSFREMLDACDRILTPHLDTSLIDILYNTKTPRNLHPINQTALTQPSLFSLEASLAQLLIRWGIKPAAVMGHSLGESAASYIAGVFNLENGLRMVAQRGALMQAMPHNGVMVAVESDAQTVQSLISAHADENSVGIAAYNGPQSIVISGKKNAVDHIAQLLKGQDIRIVPLRVSHAFHSELMSPMVAPFKDFISNLNLSTPTIPLVSTVTGRLVSDEITSPEHWGQGVRQSVRFEQAINTMVSMGITTFVEIGPHPVLSGMGRNCVPNNVNVRWLPLLRKGRDDWSILLQTIGQLYCQGIDVDWRAFDEDYKQMRSKVQLPTYAFQRQRHWMDSLPPRFHDAIPLHSLKTGHPLLGRQLQLPGKLTTHYEAKFTPNEPSWIKGHQFYNQIVMPAAAYLEMALALAFQHLNTHNVELSNIVFHNLLHISDEGAIVQCQIHKKTDTLYAFEIYSHPVVLDEDAVLQWDLNATGLLEPLNETPDDICRNVNVESLYNSFPYISVSKSHYKCFQLQGFICNKDFQTLEYAKFNASEGMAQIKLSEDATKQNAYHIHPLVLDGGMQLAGLLLPIPPVLQNNIPISIDKARFYGWNLKSAWCLCQPKVVEDTPGVQYRVDLTYYDDNGSPVVILEDVGIQTMRGDVFLKTSQPKWRDWLYKIAWRQQAQHIEERVPKKNHQWLIFNDTQGVGQRLVKQINDSGHACILVNKGSKYTKINNTTYQINPNNTTDFQQLVHDIKTTENQIPSVKGIIHLWSLDLDIPPSEDIIQEMLDYSIGSVLNIIQFQVNNDRVPSTKLRFVTRGSLSVTEHDKVHGLMQAPLWGLSRVVNLEHPELDCRMIDLDPASPSEEIDMLLAEIYNTEGDPEIAFRQSIRFVPKLVDVDEPERVTHEQGELTFPRTTAYRLKTGTRGLIDSLYLEPTIRRVPMPNEIELAVRATGLNFIDVLDAMGLLPFERPSLGGECAGVITAIGESVTQFKVGDRVVALTPGSFSRYVIASEHLTAIIPDNLSYEQAAGIPIVYLTAYFALYQQAKLSSQDRILIHAAAGGVGFAAVQLAKRTGARIFTSASTSKWDFLRDQGITQIMNSRTLDFKSELFRATNGQGVEVVLNSLSGDFIPASLSSVALNGRFIEIGKRAIWSQSQVEELRPDIDYVVYDLISHTVNSPSVVGDAMRQIFKWIASGELLPPPITPFPIQTAKEAFHFMQEAKHIGKIIITQSEIKQKYITESRQHRLKGAYLVTGGWGALGIEIVSWLAYHGAQQIIVIGRSAPDEKATEVIKMIRDIGIMVTLVKADVADSEAMKKILEQIKEDSLPLHGIFHVAGVLDDGVLKSLTREQFERVMKVKVQGAWNLHLLTLDQQLDFFVLYSSVASVFGSPGQANYAAANAFLDGLAHYRKRLGIAGLSINWGPWSGGGMATRTGTEQTLADYGVQSIPPNEGMQVFQDLIFGDCPQPVVFPIDWQKEEQSKITFSTVFSEFLDNKRTNDQRGKILEQIRSAPFGMQRTILASHIREIISRVLRLPTSTHINDRESFVDLGMDSLMTVELRNIVQESLNITLPTTLFFNYPTLDSLITFLTDKISISDSGHILIEEPYDPEYIQDNLDTLSEDELNLRLNAKLEQLEKYTDDYD